MIYKISILVNADASIATISNSVPSSTVTSSITTASTGLSTTYSIKPTGSIGTIHTSSTSTKTTSPTTTIQNIISQITEASQSTTFKNHVAQNAIDGLLDSCSQTNSEDEDPYISLLLTNTYSIKWVNLVYGDQSGDYRKLESM